MRTARVTTLAALALLSALPCALAAATEPAPMAQQPSPVYTEQALRRLETPPAETATPPAVSGKTDVPLCTPLQALGEIARMAAKAAACSARNATCDPRPAQRAPECMLAKGSLR